MHAVLFRCSSYLHTQQAHSETGHESYFLLQFHIPMAKLVFYFFISSFHSLSPLNWAVPVHSLNDGSAQCKVLSASIGSLFKGLVVGHCYFFTNSFHCSFALVYGCGFVGASAVSALTPLLQQLPLPFTPPCLCTFVRCCISELIKVLYIVVFFRD